MILNCITLCNFRAYRGIHRIELKPRGEENSRRPIVLFGGLNGSGKTSILLGIRLALYGRLAIGNGETKANYRELIRGCIHTSASSLVQLNSAYVELDFCYGKLGEQSRYVIRRSWTDTGREIREHLDLYVDGTLNQTLSVDAKQGFLNDLIPIGVSDLFFFDGEKIAELAEDDSGRVLKDALNRMLGLDLIERLRNDLRVYLLRRGKEYLDNDIRQDIEAIEKDYESLKDALTEFTKDLQVTQEQRVNLEAQKDRLNFDMTARGGEWRISREKQEKRVQDLAQELKAHEKELREVLSSEYPLSLAMPLLEKLYEELSKNLIAITRTQSNELLTKFASTLRASLNDDGINALDKALAHWVKPVEREYVNSEFSLQAIGRIERSINHGINESRLKMSRILRETRKLEEHMDIASLQLQQAPDEAVLASEFNQLSKLNESISETKAEIAVRTHELTTTYSRTIELARALRNKHLKLSEVNESKRPIRYAAVVRQILSDFHSKIAERKLNQLEHAFTHAFNRLMRKSDFISCTRIDPHKFSVSLLNVDGNEIKRSNLSAGEKQIYAIAMLEALGSTSEHKLPVVIDTPLGRLDSLHRTNLVEEYFPNASHQVVLLSTDTEVDEAFFNNLNPVISHAFEIVYNESTCSAELQEGYFWRAKVKAAA